EVTVHHIAMEHSAAAIQRRFRIFAEPREVCGKNRGCQFDGHGQRAAPSVSRENRLYAEVLRCSLKSVIRTRIRASPRNCAAVLAALARQLEKAHNVQSIFGSHSQRGAS